MPSLWFVVPAAGRFHLTAICLRQLRRTCDQLEQHGVRASAVVVADDDSLDTARELGFGWVKRDNQFTSQKFNDGIQKACDVEINPRPVDYVVPCGSDDWVDWRLFVDLPAADTMVGFQRMSFVREDGGEISESLVNYPGGCGIRIYPRQLFEPFGYRPADEHRRHGCDTSILYNLRAEWGYELQLRHPDSDPRQIVDWKSPTEQINSYDDVGQWRRNARPDPFETLADIYPADALDEMRSYYRLSLVAA